MFREMRRKDRELPLEECKRILEKSTSGVLALNGDNNYPYQVPLNHIYINEKLIFHCAKVGYKIDLLKKCSKASYSIIESENIDYERCTAYFKSLIAFGNIRIIEDEAKKMEVFESLARKFSNEYNDKIINKVKNGVSRVHILEFEIEKMTGKEKLPNK